METFSAWLGLRVGNSLVTGEFASQRPVTGSLMFSFICAWTNGWVNNRGTGDLRRYCAHYDVILMIQFIPKHIKLVLCCSLLRIVFIQILHGYFTVDPVTQPWRIWIYTRESIFIIHKSSFSVNTSLCHINALSAKITHIMTIKQSTREPCAMMTSSNGYIFRVKIVGISELNDARVYMLSLWGWVK